MQTVAYVDGFNFYFACYQGEANLVHACAKWLDFAALCRAILPADDVTCVHYYTARVPASAGDDSKPTRQDMYLRALAATGGVVAHIGKFRESKRDGVLVQPIPGVPRRQKVYVRQEKGSDVALASHLIANAFRHTFEQALVVSNDSDLAEPIRIVAQEIHLPVIVVSPDKTMSRQLGVVATRMTILDKRMLSNHQLPNPVVDESGHRIWKPSEW